MRLAGGIACGRPMVALTHVFLACVFCRHVIPVLASHATILAVAALVACVSRLALRAVHGLVLAVRFTGWYSMSTSTLVGHTVTILPVPR